MTIYSFHYYIIIHSTGIGTHHPSYAHMTPYSAREMLDGDVVVLAKGCLASSENDPARGSG